MNKRPALEWAIWIVLILDVILLAVFLVLHITDTRLAPDGGSTMNPPAAAPIVTDARAPEDNALQPGEAEHILNAGDDSGRSMHATLNIGDTQIEADLVNGSFRQRGGPEFSLYVDSTQFGLTENEGRCYVTASGSNGAKLYLELAFLPNTDSASVAQSLLNSYGAVTTNPAEKTTAFGGFSAVRVTGSSAETDLDAYLISVNGGCLTVVKCVPGYAGDEADCLQAILDSLVIVP